MQRRFDVGEFDFEQIPLDALEDLAQDPATQTVRVLAQSLAIDDEGGSFGSDANVEQSRDIRRNPGFFVADDGGELGKGACGFGIEFSSQLGQQMVANPVAPVSEVSIGGVLAPDHVLVGEPGANVRTARLEQWAVNPIVPHGLNSGETTDAGAADDSEQERFCLIVERMAGEDRVPGELLKPVVAEAAKFVFCSGLRGNTLCDEFAAENPGLAAYGFLVAVALVAAQAVVHMQESDPTPNFARETCQRHGVSPAADRHAHMGCSHELRVLLHESAKQDGKIHFHGQVIIFAFRKFFEIAMQLSMNSIVTIVMLRPILRRLIRAPYFTAVSILALGLGIGANTAVFTVVHSVLIRPLPFAEPERLVGLWLSAPGIGLKELNASPATYFLFREESKAFEDSALWRDEAVNITGTAEPERISSLVVTDGLLPVLGVQPMLGRRFTRQDDSPGQPETVMLTYGYWQRKFGGDRTVIGKRLLIDSRAREVIGVLPESFQFMNENPSVLLPMQIDRSKVEVGNFSHQSVGRLRPGMSLAQAQSDVARMLPMLLRKFPPPPGMSPKMIEDARLQPNLRELKDDYIGDIGKTLWVLMAMIGMVLMIACANVANLFLVRVESRDRELSVRTALGATRGHLARDLLVESGILGIAGGVVGILLAMASLGLLKFLAPPYLPRLGEIRIDGVVLGFTLAISVLSSLVLGFVPLWKQTRRVVSDALRGGGRTMSDSRDRHFARNVLVVLQVTLAVVLLTGAGLMIRTMMALTGVDPGFRNPESVMTFRISIPDSLVPDSEKTIRTFDSIVAKLAALPGVSEVGITSSITMDGNHSNDPIFIENRAYREGEIPPLRRYKFIGPNSFRTLGNPIKAGRDLKWEDIYGYRPVVMISESLAIEFWGSAQAAIGKRLRESPKGEWREVVGVAGDDRDNGVDQPATKSVYWPLAIKQLWGGAEQLVRSQGIVIRTSRAGTESLMNEIRQAVWSVNPNLPIANPRTLQSIYERSMARTSFTLVMLTLAAGLALVLGIIGIYAVLSYTVSQRRQEIGIRLALGCPEGSVRAMFLWHGLKLAAIGVCCGLAVAFPLSQLMATLLYGVNPMDPATYLGVAIALIVPAGLAAYLPARRATQVSPLDSLSSC